MSARDTCVSIDPLITRSSSDRVFTGLAGGLGERLGLDPIVVRLAFVVLAFAGGIGVLAYVALALVSRAPGEEPSSASAEPPRTSPRQALSVVLVVAGVLLVCREAGLWFGDGVVVPAGLAVIGSALIWGRGSGAHRARWIPRVDVLEGRRAGLRTLAGGIVVLAGVVAFLRSNRPAELIGNAPLAVAAVLIGLAVVAGPWVWRLARQVALERRERIRQEERAEVAAHLHDSVLQTLALIQRTDDADEMASLARVQERELRTWLYGKTPAGGADSLSAALDRVASEIERTHRRRVEVVLVGDCRLDDAVRALVDACREAMVNAARHSGARGVSVYVEVEDDQVTAFVRDQGVGFSRAGVPPDRRGIAESIEGRMERNGGVALVESSPGRGTEVRLRIPRSRA
jgi:signal transduction histidine kinase/phage shock protein PspC (stress-responsive transcriptional regulator)